MSEQDMSENRHFGRYLRRIREDRKLSLDAVQVAGGHELVLTEERADTLVALDEALERLAQMDQRQSRIVECRFYGGMTIKETGEALGISPATVTREWAVAQAWLYQAIAE